MSTKERLAQALELAHAPLEMIGKARAGQYDDFESDSAMPIFELVSELRAAGLDALATRAQNGEFDATREEAEAWGKSEEGKRIFGELVKGK